jgi:uncharacterized protein (DUF433 family)
MRAAVSDRVSKTPGIQGGDACITGTRIPVWVLVNYCRLGGSETDLLGAYPSLTLEDLKAAWDYAESHKDEVDQSIRDNEGDEEAPTE